MFTPVKKDPTSVYEKVLLQLKTAIMHGDLKPGDKLPAERTLAEMLGVSRTSIREALKMLAASGMVEIKHGQGVFITEQKSPGNLLLDFFGQNLIDNKTLEDLFELRKLIETQNAIWACQRGSDEDIEDLANLVEKTIKMVHENEQDLVILAKQDSEFHTKLAEASGNKIIVRVMHDLLDLLDESRCHALSIPSRPLKSLLEHQEIVKALKIRDVELVRKKMLLHLTNVEEEMLKK